MGLLERADQLSALVARADEARQSGRVVLISGEAGAGKTALVHEFCTAHLVGGRVLVGRCDDLFAPRPLGPLADMARGRPGPLARALAAGDPAAAFDAFLIELTEPPLPVVVVLEDLQWADEATFDLLRYLGRRLDALRCLVLATHRSDVDARHPLRTVIGSLVGPAVTRLHLPPLSVRAVEAIADGTGVDPRSLHGRTGGNPFFVHELLAGVPDALPSSVRDMILARAESLSEPARDALDAAAVLGRRAATVTILAVAGCDEAALEEVVAAGLLVDEGNHQAFRHDLSREAVEAGLTSLRSRMLHRRALAALGDDADIVERANHAVGGGDATAIVDLGERAADRCVALGAWRQAAALYGSAVEHAGEADLEVRRRLLEARCRTCERVEQFTEAVEAGEALLGLLGGSSDDRTLAWWEGWLGGVYRCVGRNRDAWRALEAAVARLEPHGLSVDLARALGMLAQHQMNVGHNDDAISTGRRAQAMAEQLGVEEYAIHALDSCGRAMAASGDEAGFDALRQALDRASRAGVHHEVTRAALNLAGVLVVAHRPAEALAPVADGMAVAVEHELRFNWNGLLNERAGALLLLGRWDEAIADARAVLASGNASATNRTMALSHLGRIRARRGDPDPFEALDEALVLARPSEEIQLINPVRIARVEAAWLAGDLEGAAAEVEAALPLALARPEPWQLGPLVQWAGRVGVTAPTVDAVPGPIARLLAGDPRGAAAAFDDRSCPYEAADALGQSDDVDDLREALDRLEALGARPRAQQVSRRLRELGAKDVRRGPRASTRANPAGLTNREVEVAALLADGLSNAEIAERLVLSAKTVDHHVSAVLAKLAVPNRRQVLAAAARLGLALGDEVSS